MQLQFHVVTIEDLVPQDHFLRKLEACLDMSFVYEETRHLYKSRLGRPPIDPVVLVKYLLVGYLYGIPSERQIEQRIQTDNALRWYLGLDLFDRVPDHSTISQLRRRKPSFRKVFRRLFEEVVGQCIEKKLASGRVAATDSTHVKANTSKASEYWAEAEVKPGVYWERLDAYEEEGLAKLEAKTGRRRAKRKKQPKQARRTKVKRKSRTDPDAGDLGRPEKASGMHYLCHQTLDTDCGIILDVRVTPGDSHDAAPYLDQIEHIHKDIIPLQTAAGDSAYDFPLAHHELLKLGISLCVHPQRRSAPASDHIPSSSFQYDEAKDVYICPQGQALQLNTLQRSASGLRWVYASDRKQCRGCPLREQCMNTAKRDDRRYIMRSYFQAAVQRNLGRQEEPDYIQALRLRRIWSEGSFSTQKRMHNLTRVLRRGIEAAEDHCLLSATALNLKRMIRRLG